jgi:long-chain fatty acid transport protein
MTRSRSRAGKGALLALGLLAFPGAARAAGFALFEQGAKGMGFAGAFTAQADDASAVFHNAAGIAFLKGKHLYLGGTLVKPSTDFTGAGPFPGDGRLESMSVGAVPFPAVYYTQEINERLVAGVGLNVPFGLKTEWASPDTFTGRFISTRAELTGFAINPSVAYKLADRLSIGGGLDIRRTKVKLDRHVPSVNPFTFKVTDVATVELAGDNATDFGFNLGVLAKPSEKLSVGISYRHKVKQDYTGTATFVLLPTGNAQFDQAVALKLPSGGVAATTAIEYPGFASGGAAYKWNDWIFEADVNWYQWSSFGQLPIVLDGRPDLSSIVTEDYKNSWQFRFGAERRLNDAWSVRGGYFFDQTPSPAESVSALLPDSSRNGFALGGTWRGRRVFLDAGAWYVHSNQRSTEGVNRDHFDGTYTSHAITLGVSLGYSF